MNVEHKKATKSVKDLMIEWSSNSFARGGRLKLEIDVDRAQSCPFCGTTIQPYRSEFGKRRLLDILVGLIVTGPWRLIQSQMLDNLA